MVDDRELFLRFAPTWWDTVRRRAWKRACADVDVGMRQILVGGGVIAGVAVLDLASRGPDAMASDAIPGLYAAVVIGVLFLLWWGVNIVLASKDLAEESQQKIAALEAALAATTRDVTLPITGVQAHGAVGGLSVAIPAEELKIAGHAPTVKVQAPSIHEQLIALRVEGVKIRNERIDSPQDLGPWMSRVKDWEEKAKGVLQSAHNVALIRLSDVARFGTLDKGIPLGHWAHAINADHNNQLRYLSRRIDILLEIMGRL